MIKVFRKLRQRLLTENKFSKYLLYAVGEIVLVVIGILIALQINTWNEQQKQNRLEQEYYCRLLEDVVQDNEQVAVLTEASQGRLKASNQAVRLLQKDKVFKVETGIQINLSTKAIYSDFKPNNSAFEDLKSGANLNIIRDKAIVKALNNYFNKVEELISIIKVNGQHAVNVSFSHEDNFANGSVQASMTSGRFLNGMEKDVYDAIPVDTKEVLSGEMQRRLYNDALVYISANTRQLELYHLIKDEIDVLTGLLETKCTQ